MGTDTGPGWAPDACTLSAPRRVKRAADFGELFATAVTDVERPEPARLRLHLDPDPRVAARTARLVAMETTCCSFFTFTLTATAGSLVLDVAVPVSQLGALDGLAGLAAASIPAVSAER